MIGRYWRILLPIALALVWPGSPSVAQHPERTTDSSPADSFRALCAAHGARLPEVVRAASAAGFVPVRTKPALPAGFTELVAMERGTASAKQLLVVAIGKSAVHKSLADDLPVRSCVVTDASGTWDSRAFARAWTGLTPQLDAEGLAAYTYFERPDGKVIAPDEDLPGLVAALNRGEVRTLTAIERGGATALSWLVIEVPPTPVAIPAATSARSSHDSDPFAPCRWEDSGKGRSATRALHCPDRQGNFGRAAAKGLTEETPALARGGDVAAMLRLATFYAEGPEPARDAAATFAWSKRAADLGAAAGAFNMGLAYESGFGVIVDKAQAAHWYRVASDRGHTPAMINLAAQLLDDEAGIAEAVALVRRAAEQGSIDGLFDMGHLSENGKGVPKDMAEAQRWYRLAADRKDSRAMLRLGQIHVDGIGGVPRDQAEGARWMVAGVKPVLGIATAVIGIQALVLRFDDRQRRAELTREAEKDPRLAGSLGLHLADPTNPKREPAEAVRLLRIAADAHIPAAALRIGVMYAEGDGVPKDLAQAISLLQTDARIRTSASFQQVTRFATVP